MLDIESTLNRLSFIVERFLGRIRPYPENNYFETAAPRIWKLQEFDGLLTNEKYKQNELDILSRSRDGRATDIHNL